MSTTNTLRDTVIGMHHSPMVFRRCAMHRSVDAANSLRMVRCTLALVSMSTLLMASSYREPNSIDHSMRSDETTYQDNDPTVLHQRLTESEKLLLSRAVVRACPSGQHRGLAMERRCSEHPPSSLTAESRLNLASTTGSAGPWLAMRVCASMISAYVRVLWGSLHPIQPVSDDSTETRRAHKLNVLPQRPLE